MSMTPQVRDEGTGRASPYMRSEVDRPRSAALRRGWTITGVVVRRATTAGWHAAMARLRHRDVDERYSFRRQLRGALEDLGPTFVKLGQLLSARSDVISPRLQRELATLRDHAPNISRAALVAELERSLGSSAMQTFATFEFVPVACASIGQVHRATLGDGRRVAVKVCRPGVRAEIDTDVALLRSLLRFAMRVSRTARTYDPVAILDEFAIMLHAETDYNIEAENISVFLRAFENDDAVTIPTAMADLSSESLLVMDWIDGIPLNRPEELDAAGTDRAAVARAVTHAYAQMMFQSDRFHADPHPGNLIAQPDERLGIVDFGEVGYINAETRNALVRLLVAVLGRDSAALADAVLAVSRSTHDVDRHGLGPDLGTLLRPIADTTLQDIKLGAVLRELFHVLRRYGLMLPADLAVLLKTVIQCEGTANELDPAFAMSTFLAELGKRVAVANRGERST
jgi:ubiquinone biosynthesis protein